MNPHIVLLLALCLAVPVAGAVTRYDLQRPGVAGVLNDEAIPEVVAVLMQSLAQRHDAKAGRAEVMQALMDDRLLATVARSQYSLAALMEDNKVGYRPEVQWRQAMVADLQAAYGPALTAAIKAEKGGTLEGLVSARHLPVAADWAAVFGPRPKLLLEYALDENGRRQAAAITLLRYRLPGGQRAALTLLDVYAAQNVQGRHQLHQRDARFAMNQAELLLEQQYVLHWARQHLGSPGFAVFERAVQDRMLRNGWMALIGVSSDIHDDTDHLKQLAAAVTTEEVRAYYEQNRDQFRRLEKVQARHIRVADEATAQRLYQRLQTSADKSVEFSVVAQEFSRADDAAQGGALGWLVHGEPAEKNTGWLKALTFVQPVGVVSKPFRSPAGPGESAVWEILLVDEKVEGWQPVESESVRYVAAQAIARRKALAQYRETLERVRAEADIRLPAGLAPLARPALSGVADRSLAP